MPASIPLSPGRDPGVAIHKGKPTAVEYMLKGWGSGGLARYYKYRGDTSALNQTLGNYNRGTTLVNHGRQGLATLEGFFL